MVAGLRLVMMLVAIKTRLLVTIMRLMLARMLKAVVSVRPVRFVLMITKRFMTIDTDAGSLVIQRGRIAKATAITAGARFHAQISQSRQRHQP